ncbi:torsin-1A-like [Eleutherodactylus coqui]|uniref:torsin-1A-like n=1 Tax=Eleutherodactylus coqui TaxID=57060 RepID=UPI003461C706
MKLQDFYPIFTFFANVGYNIQEKFQTECDYLACHTDLVPPDCECCITEGSVNLTALQDDLEKEVFGQHLAKQVVLKLMQIEKRSKPLVLSFHGLTGSGKTYVSQFLAKHFTPMGVESKFVHKIVASASFPHVTQVKTYQDQLLAWIRGNVSRCERSLFIFDEIDKVHPEILHSLIPYLDYHDTIEGVSYRKSVFIFISNTGANVISDPALEFWRQGKRREEIQLNEVEPKLRSYLENTMGSEFYKCDLIKKNVIDVFVPFLPLELEHVKECVRAELRRQGRAEDQEAISRIANGMAYYPKGENAFSRNGCKNVHVRVNLD